MSRQFAEVGRPADGIEAAGGGQRRSQGDEIHGFRRPPKAQHGLPDHPMRGRIEIGRPQFRAEPVELRGLEQRGSQDGHFGVQVVRRHIAQSGLLKGGRRRHALAAGLAHGCTSLTIHISVCILLS